MNSINYFEICVVINMIAGFCIRLPYERLNERTAKTEASHDHLEQVILVLTFTGGLTLPFLYFLTPWFGFADYHTHFLAGLAGVCLSVPGNWLFWRSHKDLDRQFSTRLDLQTSHKLITHGVYQHIRHPMYAALLILATAQMCLIENWFVGPAYLFGILALYFYRVGDEEAFMLKHFGAEYSRYLERTNRLIPFF